MGYMIGLVVVVVLLGIAAALLKKGKPGQSASTTLSGTMPFKKNKYFLSAAEQSFYGVLKQAVAGQLDIFAKVRLLDVLWLPPQVQGKQRHKNLVQSKHVDFVLCDSKALVPMLVIELDDVSHARSDRERRDLLVDKVLTDAKLPVLRVPAKASYDVRQLAADIRQALGANR